MELYKTIGGRENDEISLEYNDSYRDPLYITVSDIFGTVDIELGQEQCEEIRDFFVTLFPNE